MKTRRSETVPFNRFSVLWEKSGSAVFLEVRFDR